jgi:hypothetical protein
LVGVESAEVPACPLKGSGSESVLRLFGTATSKARRGYKIFVADGVSQGRRNDLVGRLPEAGSRILGNEEFAEVIRMRDTATARIETCTPIAEIANNTAAIFGIPVRALSAGGRREATVTARSMVCFLALE